MPVPHACDSGIIKPQRPNQISPSNKFAKGLNDWQEEQRSRQLEDGARAYRCCGGPGGILSHELMQEQRLGRSNDGCGCRDWMAHIIRSLFDGLIVQEILSTMKQNPGVSTFGMNFDISCKPKPSNYFNILKILDYLLYFFLLLDFVCLSCNFFMASTVKAWA